MATAQQLADLMALPDRQLTPQDLHHILAELAELRLAMSNMTGAAAGVLNAIHRAGGYTVFDPRHRVHVQRCMRALEDTTVAWLNRHGELADAHHTQDLEAA